MARRNKIDIPAVRVLRIEPGLTQTKAEFSIACRMRGFKLQGFTYDSRTGRARAW